MINMKAVQKKWKGRGRRRGISLLLIAAVTAAFLAGCSGKADKTGIQETESSAEGTQAPLPAAEESGNETEEAIHPYLGRGTVGDQWYTSVIEGSITPETEVSLKNDFFTAVNQEYICGLAIEDGYMTAGVFNECSRIMRERTMGLIQNPTPESHEAELVGSLYELVLDWEGRNQAGMDPIMETADKIRAIASIEDVSAFLQDQSDLLSSMLMNIHVGSTIADPETYSVGIYATPIFLEDAAEYKEKSENGELLERYYDKVVVSMLKKIGLAGEEAESVLAGCKAFETAIAEHMLTTEEQYADDIYDKISGMYTLEELRSLQGNYPLTEIIAAFGMDGSDAYNLSEPEWLSGLSDLYTEENVEMIRDYLLAHYVADTAFYLDRETYEEMTGYANEKNGVTGMRSDEELGAAIVGSYLSEPLDYVYIDAYCSEEERQQVIDMVNDFREYYRGMLEQEDWLSDETRQKAIEKLDSIKIRACYSDTRKDYSGLTFASKAENGLYIDALRDIGRHSLSMIQEKINQKVNPDEWDMSVRDVNAYYNPMENSVTMLCGFLVGDFSLDQSYEAVLATVGNIIGHEISHAFDTLGAQFDKDGNYENWWTEEDYAAFGKRADRLAAYMNQIIPFEGAEHVKGDQQKTEMIADMGSCKASMRIAAEREDFDYDAYFQAYAESWANIETRNIIVNQLQTDSHPLDNLRVNIPLQHSDEFMELYEIEPGDGMYLAPEDRVNVW